VPKAIEFMKENNWWQVAADCRALARNNYQRFCDLLGSSPLCPLNDDFLGQMCSVQIKSDQPEKLQRYLFDNYKIEVPVMRHEKYVFIRYTVQVFNTQEQLDKLYNALKETSEKTDLLKV
jgi:isopenicillin-N epimerase